MSAATPAEWASAASLGLSAVGLIGLALAFADADLDPRPAVCRALTSPAADRVLITVGPVLYDARTFAAEARLFARLSLREAALSVAAVLALLLPPSEVTR